jgi:signal transduction histidine kinase
LTRRRPLKKHGESVDMPWGFSFMPIRVLVVDDSTYDRELTARALARLPAPIGPVEVVGVGDWRAAEPLVADGGLDLILLDFHLPALNGLDVLHELRGRVHPPVIMMTGQNDVATAVETLRAGAGDYVTKGDDWAAALGLAVERVLDRVRLERELADSRAQLSAYASALEEKVETRTAVVRAQAAEIEDLYLRVEEAARLKAEIVANVSHELRTPLNAIFGYTELLQEHVAGEPAAMLDAVRSQAERLHGLVESLLRLGRLRSGTEGVLATEFDLVDVVDELRAQAAVLNADRGLSLRWTAPPAPCPVMQDREKVRTIAYHLVNNAIKFTPVGEVEVTWEAADGRILLTVRDTGIGFPNEARALIFEDFRQLDGSITRRYEGTGLGLGIVRRCTELLGGTIRSDSAPARGTTIVVELPARLGDEPGATAQRPDA